MVAYVLPKQGVSYQNSIKWMRKSGCCGNITSSDSRTGEVCCQLCTLWSFTAQQHRMGSKALPWLSKWTEYVDYGVAAWVWGPVCRQEVLSTRTLLSPLLAARLTWFLLQLREPAGSGRGDPLPAVRAGKRGCTLLTVAATLHKSNTTHFVVASLAACPRSAMCGSGEEAVAEQQLAPC